MGIIKFNFEEHRGRYFIYTSNQTDKQGGGQWKGRIKSITDECVEINGTLHDIESITLIEEFFVEKSKGE